VAEEERQKRSVRNGTIVAEYQKRKSLRESADVEQ
jgi:hypothetical protein